MCVISRSRHGLIMQEWTKLHFKTKVYYNLSSSHNQYCRVTIIREINQYYFDVQPYSPLHYTIATSVQDLLNISYPHSQASPTSFFFLACIHNNICEHKQKNSVLLSGKKKKTSGKAAKMDNDVNDARWTSQHS